MAKYAMVHKADYRDILAFIYGEEEAKKWIADRINSEDYDMVKVG